ncbi:unnamed protein product [Oppiella nova]|uniref:Ig-like domain-containing protein n=1 Tax=Oppiella nova TaxID=334625 RepID=A0A7R9QHH5_9ACAR|nr:unnamed protein product [Oppiella nova]CAG2165936.1 unnamed protein product [Oppiella nova]
MPSKDDSITLILWYRGDTTGGPIYSVDARQMPTKQGQHFLSDDLTNRATLNISIRPAILTIDPVRAEDEGEYRCRVDFRWGRTMNTVVGLIVIATNKLVEHIPPFASHVSLTSLSS